MEARENIELLNSIYNKMHLSEEVKHHSKVSDTPTLKIAKYLIKLEDVHKKVVLNNKITLLKSYYYKKYIIKELPSTYLKSLVKTGQIALIDKELEEYHLQKIQENQQASLDIWIMFFLTSNYPIWFQNYVFQGMIKLNKFNKETNTFSKRSKTTTDAFIELNEDIIQNIYNELNNEEETTIECKSFKRLYTYYIVNNKHYSNEGIWIKYNKGDNYQDLWNSLQGKYTGWCTVLKHTAQKQLKQGDFYVYYTKDKNDKFLDPRVAIWMNDDVVKEVRGILPGQKLEEVMKSTARDKVKRLKVKNKKLIYYKKD